jgi:hypothetical protein
MVPKPTDADAQRPESARENNPGASNRFLHLKGSIVKGFPAGGQAVQASRKRTQWLVNLMI